MISLLSADALPVASTALTAITFGPGATQYVIVSPLPIELTVDEDVVRDLRLRIDVVR